MDSLQKLFAKLPQRQAPKDLFEKILSRISQKQKNRALWEFVVSGIVFTAALVLFFPVVGLVHNAMVHSGSYDYLSMFFSNFSEVVTSWQDFALSLLESLPILGIAAFLAIVFFLLGSLRFLARDVKILFLRHHF